jgi:hypothetical protein
MQTDLLKHSGRYFKIAFSSIPQFHSRPLPHWSNHPQGEAHALRRLYEQKSACQYCSSSLTPCAIAEAIGSTGATSAVQSNYFA